MGHRSVHPVLLALLAVCLALPVSAGPAPVSDPVRVEQSVGDTAVSDLVFEGYRLGYEGTNVTSVTLLVNNTGSDLTADVAVALETKNGTTRTKKTKSDVLLAPGANEITVSLNGTYAPTRFARLRARVASSL